MGREKRLRKVENAGKFATWLEETNDILRAKTMRKHFTLLLREFDIVNDTKYNLAVEVNDEAKIIITDLDEEPTKGATKMNIEMSDRDLKLIRAIVDNYANKSEENTPHSGVDQLLMGGVLIECRKLVKTIDEELAKNEPVYVDTLPKVEG